MLDLHPEAAQRIARRRLREEDESCAIAGRRSRSAPPAQAAAGVAGNHLSFQGSTIHIYDQPLEAPFEALQGLVAPY
jgi:hypothetical protein